MQTRPDINIRGGGDFIQMSKTKEFLEKLGVDVDISTNSEENLSNYDVVHIFNTPFFEHSYKCLSNAKSQKKPAVFSTIYWNQEELAIECYKGKFDLLKKTIGKPLGQKVIRLKNKFSKNYKILKKILHESDVLLPNSEAEKELLIADFGLPYNKEFINVPNTVDGNLFINATANDFVEKYKIDDFILCVGRIECRKNQHRLIEAMKDTNIPIVLVGATNFDKDYYALCKQKADERRNVIFIPDLPHDSLPSVYKAAKVHALPSWYDTPGLSNLEAILADCNIATTTRGPMQEYFSDFAYLCEPDDNQSIRDAILKAYKNPFNKDFKKFILDNFTWEKTALKTLEGYKIAIENNS